MILALDFDGVVWDSVGECYQMARRAYQVLYGSAPAEVEAAFRRGRWLVRCGGDFLMVLWLALEDPERDWDGFPKAEFARLLQERAEELSRFEKEFYAQRERCRDQEPQAWLAMQRPYPELLAELPEWRRSFSEVVLCTTKDEASARKLLSSVGMEMAIWGREHGVHKGDQVRDLCRTRGVAPEQVLFLDDLLDNLEQVEPTGARLALADWGYNTSQEREEARRRAIPVVSPGKVSSLREGS